MKILNMKSFIGMAAKSLIALSCICSAAHSSACTSAIISGKATADGRPLLWKNRDTDNLKNCVRNFRGERYSYVAIVSYADNPRSIWSGANEAGFAIINTLSYNLSDPDTEKRVSTRNGALMKRALEICGSVDDFKTYLDTLSRPMKVEANYGVIDANGGAAYFEVDNQKYTMFDVNDSEIAPYGYLVRSNFSVSGHEGKGAGYVRYLEADDRIEKALDSTLITPRWIMDNLTRSFSNPLMGIDLKSGNFNKPHTNGWFVEQDIIARRSSSCASVVQGVKPGEDPSFTVMWTAIGYPPVSPVIPIWVNGADKKMPRMLVDKLPEGKFFSPVCDRADSIRRQVYNYKMGSNTENYFNWELLYNNNNDGFIQQTVALENELFDHIYCDIDKWRANKALPTDSVYKLYDNIDSIILDKFINR